MGEESEDEEEVEGDEEMAAVLAAGRAAAAAGDAYASMAADFQLQVCALFSAFIYHIQVLFPAWRCVPQALRLCDCMLTLHHSPIMQAGSSCRFVLLAYHACLPYMRSKVRHGTHMVSTVLFNLAGCVHRGWRFPISMRIRVPLKSVSSLPGLSHVPRLCICIRLFGQLAVCSSRKCLASLRYLLSLPILQTPATSDFSCVWFPTRRR